MMPSGVVPVYFFFDMATSHTFPKPLHGSEGRPNNGRSQHYTHRCISVGSRVVKCQETKVALLPRHPCPFASQNLPFEASKAGLCKNRLLLMTSAGKSHRSLIVISSQTGHESPKRF